MEKNKALRMLLPYLWSNNSSGLKFRVILSLFFLSCGKIMNIGIPIAYKYVIDELSLPIENFMFVIIGLLAYGGTRICAQLFNELRDIVFARVGQNAARLIALEVFRHMHNLSLRFHISRKTGSLMQGIERGTKGIETFLRYCLFNIIPTALEICLVCGVLWTLYDFWFALITLLTIIAYIIYTLSITEWRISFVRTANKIDSEAHHKAVESLLNFETVKYFGNEVHEAEKFNTLLVQYEEATVKSFTGLSVLNIGQNIIITLGLLSSMFLAGLRISTGEMTVGDFVLVNTYLIQLSSPLFMLGFAYREIKNSIVSMEDMFKLLNINIEVSDHINSTDLKISTGLVKFDDVGFFYSDDRPILKNINFTIEQGKMLAIIGTSGAGKSTIARLLFRFFDVTEGNISIDGQDIRSITQSSLRSIISVVPQDTVLFNDTIYYNIAYGRLDASYEEVTKAAKQARIHELIESLPDKYNSIVGERGLKLSGGEKQRVSIARAILKNPLIYIFDEATSALDTNTEKSIQESLRSVGNQKTKIVIAHRLSTITDADEIILIDKGTIVERGTHQKLISQGGKYFEMWNEQQAESIVLHQVLE